MAERAKNAHPLVRLAHGFYGAAALGISMLVILPAGLVVIVLPSVRARRWMAQQTARLLFLALGIPLRTQGLRHLPEEACVVVANHGSYLDGIILTATLPPKFSFVIKTEMKKVPFAGMLLKRIGSEFVERDDSSQGAADARRIMRRAASGQALGFFPEGTFYDEPGLGRFRLGAFIAAARAQLPVIPIVIRGSRAILPSDVWWPRWGMLSVTLFPAIKPTGQDGVAARVLRDAARAIILEACGEPDSTAALENERKRIFMKSVG